MELRLLGPLEVVLPGENTAADGAQGPSSISLSPSLKELLALLAVHWPEVISSERIIDALWPTETDELRARHRLQTRVSQLRGSLESERDAIVTRHPGYGLSADVELDTEAFKQLVARSEEEADVQQARSLIDDALAMWRGDPLSDFAYDDWAQLAIAAMNDVYQRAKDIRLEAGVALGEGPRLLEELAQAVKQRPLDERIRAQYMEALDQSGRQADATSEYWEFRDLLADQKGLDPQGEIEEMYARILAHDEVTRLPVNPHPFFGREADIADIVQLLGDRPLVTLTGIGGTGKTRLAIEAARRVSDEYPGGAVFVDLGSVADGESVDSSVAAALGLRQSPARSSFDRLSELLSSKPTLIVLDNCEHVLPAVADLVGGLLRTVPHAHILATSRYPLAVDGEQRFPVGPLATDPGEFGLPAVDLLLDRARLGAPRVPSGSEDLQAAVEVCELLGGLPLAIELAANRLSVKTVPELLEELRTGLIADDDDPLRSAIDWSYKQLDDPAQRLFRTLGVSIGGQSSEALSRWSSQYALADEDVFSTMNRLVEAVLVSRVVVDGESRFMVLEPVRQHALRLLGEAGERESAELAHLAIYSDLASHFRIPLLIQPTTAQQVTAELGNLSAAMQRGLERKQDAAAATIAESLDYYWVFVGKAREGRGWIERLVDSGFLDRAASTAGSLTDVDQRMSVAGVCRARGFLASVDLAYAEAKKSFAEAIEEYDRLTEETRVGRWPGVDPSAIEQRHLRAVRGGAWARFLLARNLTSMHVTQFGMTGGDEELVIRAQELYQQARKTFEQREMTLDLAYLIPFIGWNERHTGSPPAHEWPDYGLEMATKLNLAVPRGIAQANLALHHLVEGDSPELAFENAKVSAQSFREIGDLYSLQIALTITAIAALRTGREQDTADALAEALHLVGRIGSGEWAAWTVGVVAVWLATTDNSDVDRLSAWLSNRNPGWRRLLASTGVPPDLLEPFEAAAPSSADPLTSSASAARAALDGLAEQRAATV